MLAFLEAHAADVDALDVNAMLHHVEDAGGVGEEQQALLILILGVVVNADSLLQVNHMALDASGSNLLQEGCADGVLGHLVIADDDAAAAGHLGPDSCYLTMDKTVINACKYDIHN